MSLAAAQEALRASILETEALTATFSPRLCSTAGTTSRLDASQQLPPGTGAAPCMLCCPEGGWTPWSCVFRIDSTPSCPIMCP